MEEGIITRSVELAERWQKESNRLKSKRQIEFDEKVAKMVRNPVNKVFLTELIDQSFRPRDSKRVADQIAYLIGKYKNVDLFDSFESLLIELFNKVGKRVPSVSVPAIVGRIRSETSGVILDGEEEALSKHVSRRKKENIGSNVNIIGEALLGEDEAVKRIQIYKDALESDTVNYLSIKISTIYSQITPLAFDETVEVLVDRLSDLFACAQRCRHEGESGEMQAKFINLDMEEYRDLALTVEAFQKTLDKPEFKGLRAGIVLQAYLPDSYYWHRKLTEWAKARVGGGGAPIKLRIVKGANMDMEQTESSMRGWPQAPYHEKLDTDANYKRMLRYALQPENARCVELGIASHNLFELAHAHLLARDLSSEKHMVFEMLEGMADATVKALRNDDLPILLYAPVATKEHFTHAIAYYVRRLDENTSPQNFLTHSFNLEPGDEDWAFLANQFRFSFGRIERLRSEAFRTQNRLDEKRSSLQTTFGNDRFKEEPDTDWTLAASRDWAELIRGKWKAVPNGKVEEIPISVGEEFLYENLDTEGIIDHSQYEKNLPIARYALARIEDIDRAMEIAANDESGWAEMTLAQRHETLSAAAQELRDARGDLIGVAAAEVGKLFSETDPEVSEAIDFAEFYPFAMQRFVERTNLEFESKGVGVVIPPWNFPIAIPAGGVLASLAAGNNTILKPSPQATYCGWIICQALWKAGVPRKALQFLPCSNDPEASHLAAHPKTAFVIFTGSTRTALKMLQKRPQLPLYAETGGKNAMIISSMADRDKAIADVIQSAYGNAGQKCSATSLVLLQRSLFEDKSFKAALVDAAKSLPVGYAWEFKSKFGPLANPVGGPLKKAIDTIGENEEWALQPEVSETDPHMVTPGILWNVSQSSFCYRKELFGPVIGVMRYETLDEAIRLVNETDYGLTSGIHSLDEREIAKWREEIRAGNLYINRGTTGAIVLRQPFGGMAKSAIGPGVKVGGWNYPLEFCDAVENGLPRDRRPNDPLLTRFDFMIESFPEQIEETDVVRLRAAFESSLFEYENVFSKIEDYFKIRGETNQSRYLKIHDMAVRVEASDSPFSIFSRLFNAYVSKTELTISVSPEVSEELRDWLRMHAPDLLAEFVVEEQSELCARMLEYERIRFASPEPVSDELWEAAAKRGIYVAASPPLIDARLELLLYFREQCVTHCYHRYGNLGQHQLDVHAADVLAPGALPEEVYRTNGYEDSEEDEE
ncbi:bifunctional proline dehydrogenase/L-glutamate gamma-semialdehyde dehydrogenase [Pelagicoccus sp. SDUM812002]|uniref:bifunctional proline dehydrogenase/L-glutamate gamma-semialdehyde dehydrogenase n=1 Tax=Pelagicoccus sp. SDUM812002 TaxID=3041266 RepID=UPI00281037D3|nr:bifunctional proline dehydrogenase/L-glutamate gamma-semialdehyde dehydrogenase [Pelagicoccus sp. SDUM812002]MDQ8185186.1 bifunctional proline dehydrogenase/L-glutamate gamma-semialdehyde dehydrogenase [Pelagicoccus sp. SDUM812002]